MIRVVHKDCGKVAFYFRKKLKRGDTIRASNVINIDGTVPRVGMEIICGNCGRHFSPRFENCEQQHWTDWFVIKY